LWGCITRRFAYGLPISPKGRPKGAKAAGLRYEKALAAAIPRAEHGQWFEFTDLNGPGHCQMDLLIVGNKRVVILECKLTDVQTGRAQLGRPVFSHRSAGLAR